MNDNGNIKCYKVVRIYPDGTFGPGVEGCDINLNSIAGNYSDIFSLKYEIGKFVKPNFGRIFVHKYLESLPSKLDSKKFKIFECEGKRLSSQIRPKFYSLSNYSCEILLSKIRWKEEYKCPYTVSEIKLIKELKR